jgi:hypothetical protein
MLRRPARIKRASEEVVMAGITRRGDCAQENERNIPFAVSVRAAAIEFAVASLKFEVSGT